MGKILTIRVRAVTFREEDVFAAWPTLCSLAWPGKGHIFSDGWKPDPVVFAPPVAANATIFGVTELVQALLEESRLGDWPPATKKALHEGLKKLEGAQNALQTALADWQLHAANTATNTLEDILTALEDLAR